MDKTRPQGGELTKRLWFGFEKVLDGIADELSIDAFARALPKEVDASEVRRDFVETLKSNSREAFTEVLDQHDILEKLILVESTLGPTIKGRRYPAIAKQPPMEAATNYILEAKLTQKKRLDERISTLKAELSRKRQEVEDLRKKARKTADDFELIRKRFVLSGEEADTEPEES